MNHSPEAHPFTHRRRTTSYSFGGAPAHSFLIMSNHTPLQDRLRINHLSALNAMRSLYEDAHRFITMGPEHSFRPHTNQGGEWCWPKRRFEMVGMKPHGLEKTYEYISVNLIVSESGEGNCVMRIEPNKFAAGEEYLEVGFNFPAGISKDTANDDELWDMARHLTAQAPVTWQMIVDELASREFYNVTGLNLASSKEATAFDDYLVLLGEALRRHRDLIGKPADKDDPDFDGDQFIVDFHPDGITIEQLEDLHDKANRARSKNFSRTKPEQVLPKEESFLAREQRIMKLAREQGL